MDLPDDDVDDIVHDGPSGTGIGCQDDAAVADVTVSHMLAVLLQPTALVQANVTR